MHAGTAQFISTEIALVNTSNDRLSNLILQNRVFICAMCVCRICDHVERGTFLVGDAATHKAPVSDSVQANPLICGF
jgi:hypothetical protein